MKKEIIGIIVCVLLVGAVIPISGQIIKGNVIMDSDKINPYLNGNTWIKTFDLNDYDIGYTVQQTTDGGYILVGYTYPPNENSKVWIIKTDNKGDMVWDKKYDGGYGHNVKQTSDGGYIIEGWKITSRTLDIWLIKTDEVGDIIWDKTFDISDGLSWDIEQTNDGGYIISGLQGPPGNSDGFLLKTDEFGELEWYSNYDVSSDDGAFSVVQTEDEGYVAVGYRSPFEGTDELAVWLFKTNSEGEMLWEKSFSGGYNDGGSYVQITDDGGYIITGVTTPSKLLIYDVLLIKTDDEGELLWRKTFGGKYDDWGFDVQQTYDGGYIIIGETRTLFGRDALLIKTNSDGEELWIKNYDERLGDETASSGQQTIDGGFILIGHRFNGLDTDVLLIKTDSNGNVLRNRATFNSYWSRFFDMSPILQKILKMIKQGF